MKVNLVQEALVPLGYGDMIVAKNYDHTTFESKNGLLRINVVNDHDIWVIFKDDPKSVPYSKHFNNIEQAIYFISLVMIPVAHQQLRMELN